MKSEDLSPMADRMGLADTYQRARDVQIALLRTAGFGRRLRLVWSLSASAIELSKRALQRRHPEWSKEQLDLAFVEVSYGRALVARMRGGGRAR